MQNILKIGTNFKLNWVQFFFPTIPPIPQINLYSGTTLGTLRSESQLYSAISINEGHVFLLVSEIYHQ